MDFTCTRKIQPRRCYCAPCSEPESRIHPWVLTRTRYTHVYLRPIIRVSRVCSPNQGEQINFTFFPILSPSFLKIIAELDESLSPFAPKREDFNREKSWRIFFNSRWFNRVTKKKAPHFWNPRNVYRFPTRVNSIYRRFDSIHGATRGPVVENRYRIPHPVIIPRRVTRRVNVTVSSSFPSCASRLSLPADRYENRLRLIDSEGGFEAFGEKTRKHLCYFARGVKQIGAAS